MAIHEILWDPENGGKKLIRNAGNHLPTASRRVPLCIKPFSANLQHSVQVWVGPKAGLEALKYRKITCLHQKSKQNSSLPARSLSKY
jgi:hypothetical protein